MNRYISVWNSDDLARDSTSSGEERREHQDENNSERETNSIRGSSSRKFNQIFIDLNFMNKINFLL